MLRKISDIPYSGTVTFNGKFVELYFSGRFIPVAKGFYLKPNSYQFFWIGEQRGWFSTKREVAIPIYLELGK